MGNPILDVIAERTKQKEKGWTAEHDDEHKRGQLVEVAVDILKGRYDRWGIFAKHQGNRRRLYVIAAALIVAEIERRDREEATKGGA